jgi:uncharacterized protein with ATP-grasp and redox domains
MTQALRVGRISTDNEDELKKILDKVGMLIKDLPMSSTPPEIAMHVYSIIREVTGNTDPFREKKKQNIKKALEIYPRIKQIIEESDDSLLTAVRIAIAGNVIDLGIDRAFDIEEEILKSLHTDLAINDYSEFREKIYQSDRILYIGDNSGEAVFDRLLIEELDKPVAFVVRGKPIINDVTTQEAVETGVDRVAEIISSGTEAPGSVMHTCTPNFREEFENAQMIISKGQGNYEALSDIDAPTFFLLKAKCKVIAEDLGVTVDSLVLASRKIS